MLVLQLSLLTNTSHIFGFEFFFHDRYIEGITNAIQMFNNEAHNRNNDTVVVKTFNNSNIL